ncbi:hypothetical protein VNO78_20546 [Psophocarpus tetragonolobus]|uniref:Uncharacterized protein n=1 Tax=Psophocarpus tetragonolobus TaxID=3891 RepID=A0AAN9S9L7_PSOTE
MLGAFMNKHCMANCDGLCYKDKASDTYTVRNSSNNNRNVHNRLRNIHSKRTATDFTDTPQITIALHCMFLFSFTALIWNWML